MPTDIMIDIETMGSSPNAAVASIGAVAFDWLGDDLPTPDEAEYFFVRVDLGNCQRLGMEFDAATIYWWLQQEEEARKALVEGTPVGLQKALRNLNTYIEEQTAGLTKLERVWSHGATFDLVILGQAYRRAGVKQPWSFRQARDTRTLYNLYYIPDQERPEDTNKHHPLWDAWRQARMVQLCMARKTYLEF